MTTFLTRSPQPVRRNLTDARSSTAAAPAVRKVLLNDARSTR